MYLSQAIFVVKAWVVIIALRTVRIDSNNHFRHPREPGAEVGGTVRAEHEQHKQQAFPKHGPHTGHGTHNPLSAAAATSAVTAVGVVGDAAAHPNGASSAVAAGGALPPSSEVATEPPMSMFTHGFEKMYGSLLTKQPTLTLHYNKRYGFYFFTDRSVPQQLAGPHTFPDKDGMMMIPEGEAAHQQILRALKTRGECTVVDVGSNFGYFTLLALKMGCKVYCFEPDEANFQLSQLNLRINGFTTNVMCFNNPAGPAGVIKYDGWSSLSTSANAVERQTVPISTILPFAAEIDWFKLDVEGFENNVIQSIPSSMTIHSLSIEITFFLYKDLDYSATYQMISERFGHVYHFESKSHLGEEYVKDLGKFSAKINATECDRSKTVYCQYNVICSD
jgi:FkbM family methyltransferase